MYIILYSHLYVHMHKKHVFPSDLSRKNVTPDPLRAQVGTAPAAHGALQAMDPKRSWQCTWRCGKKKRLSWFFTRKTYGEPNLTIFLQP